MRLPANLLLSTVALVLLATGSRCLADNAPASLNPIIQTLDLELKRSMTQLKHAGKAPLYYLSYRLYDWVYDDISASNGALLYDRYPERRRMLSVDLRIGSPHFDNTHFLRGNNSESPCFYEASWEPDTNLPADGDGIPLRQCLWLKTDEAYKHAQQRFSDLCAGKDVLSDEEDRSGDFSLQPQRRYYDSSKDVALDRTIWQGRIKRLSAVFSHHPDIRTSSVVFTAEPIARYIVNSEGSQLIERRSTYRISIEASALCPDGMTVSLGDTAESENINSFPNEVTLTQRVEKVAKALDELRNARAADPYTGPAIFSPKAAAVFFHETFGHRIEAIHEKNENEGKTFVRKILTAVMPGFISVIDDPTVSKAHGELLDGHYLYDDEGVPARKVVLVKNGILTGLLLSRTPVQGVSTSNGHGRCAPGWNPVARQANLFVSVDKSKQVPPQALRALLIREAKRQHKAYGLLFDEIEGGETLTEIGSAQTYFIHPLRVYKIFTDGRPDQLIRGVDIVGTPLAALERILAASTEYGVFNGQCGRDSGLIPVSAVAPSLLVQSIEVKRVAKTFEKQPILSDPSVQKPLSAMNQVGVGK